jgi:hypothetical protein
VSAKRAIAAALLPLLLHVPAATAEDMSLVVSEEALNALAERVSSRSGTGLATPKHAVERSSIFGGCYLVGFIECYLPGLGIVDRIGIKRCEEVGGGIAFFPTGDPIEYQWWIVDPYFDVRSDGIHFSASVRYRVGEQWFEDECEDVSASVYFQPYTNSLSVSIGECQTDLTYEFEGTPQIAETIDVAKLHSFSIPIESHTMTVDKPGAQEVSLTGTIDPDSVSPHYSDGQVAIRFDVVFER